MYVNVHLHMVQCIHYMLNYIYTSTLENWAYNLKCEYLNNTILYFTVLMPAI